MKGYYVKRIHHPQEGELYKFLEMNPETGQETVIDPFESGLLQLCT